MRQKKVEMECIIDLLAPKIEKNRKKFVSEIATKYSEKYPRCAINVVSKNPPKVIQRLNDKKSIIDFEFE